MKTAISIPDPLFQAAEELAQRLELSRSQLYSKAVEFFVRSHRQEGITEALNRVYAEESSELDSGWAAIQAASPGGRVVIRRGEIWWASLPEPTGSEPGSRRPLLVVQDDEFNRSRIATVLGVVLTTNMNRALAPGNVLLESRLTGLPKDSVANVSQIVTADRRSLTERVSQLDSRSMVQVENGLRMVLDLA